MELRLPLEMSPGREAACRAVFGTWGFFRTMHGKTAPSCSGWLFPSGREVGRDAEQRDLLVGDPVAQQIAASKFAAHEQAIDAAASRRPVQCLEGAAPGPVQIGRASCR